jgi:hypothetical protein
MTTAGKGCRSLWVETDRAGIVELCSYEASHRKNDPTSDRSVYRQFHQQAAMAETPFTRELTKQEVAEFREAFEMFDIDGGGMTVG